MAKVSIIVPVYNVEKYLRQCLDSVCNQTLQDIEIIIVNDGSTDNSQNIIDEYARKDNRIKVVYKENGGLASAKNAGLKIATGEYIGFVDSDDFAELNMFEELYNKAKSLDADISFCLSTCFESDTGTVLNNPYFSECVLNEDYDDVAFNWYEIKNKLFKLAVVSWNKIYRQDLIKKHNLTFFDGMGFEDNPFSFHSFIAAEKIALVRKHLYNYRLNRSGSITASKDAKKHYANIIMFDKIYEILKQTGTLEELEKYWFEYKIASYLYTLEGINKKNKKQYFKAITEDLSKMDLKKYKKIKFLAKLYKKASVIKSLSLIKSYTIFKLSNLFNLYKYPYGIEITLFGCVFKIEYQGFANLNCQKDSDELKQLLKKSNMQKRIDKFAEKYKDKKVIIYGGGLLFSIINQNYDLSKLNITAVADKRFGNKNDNNDKNDKNINIPDIESHPCRKNQ